MRVARVGHRATLKIALATTQCSCAYVRSTSFLLTGNGTRKGSVSPRGLGW